MDTIHEFIRGGWTKHIILNRQDGHAEEFVLGSRKLDVRLPGKGNSNSHGAWPVHLIISMIKWNRTSRFPIKNSLSQYGQDGHDT